MIVSLIYAQSENGVIGQNNQLPWHLPADLQHFKKITTGHTIVMGRKTYESIGRPLPNRRSVVVSRHGFQDQGVDVCPSFETAVELCAGEKEVFVIGGAELFATALAHADCVYRTIVHTNVDGDVTLPELDEAIWTLVESTRVRADEKNAFDLTFQHFIRRSV